MVMIIRSLLFLRRKPLSLAGDWLYVEICSCCLFSKLPYPLTPFLLLSHLATPVDVLWALIYVTLLLAIVPSAFLLKIRYWCPVCIIVPQFCHDFRFTVFRFRVASILIWNLRVRLFLIKPC